MVRQIAFILSLTAVAVALGGALLLAAGAWRAW